MACKDVENEESHKAEEVCKYEVAHKATEDKNNHMYEEVWKDEEYHKAEEEKKNARRRSGLQSCLGTKEPRRGSPQSGRRENKERRRGNKYEFHSWLYQDNNNTHFSNKPREPSKHNLV
jgi:hypothetical protein